MPRKEIEPEGELCIEGIDIASDLRNLEKLFARVFIAAERNIDIEDVCPDVLPVGDQMFERGEGAADVLAQHFITADDD